MMPVVRQLGRQEYQAVLADMQGFVAERDEAAQDEVWIVQHPPVYTQGTGCTMGTLLPTDIPIVKSDRGGQITYHGPGQVVIYPLLQLKRYNLGIKSMVQLLEQTAIDVLKGYDIDGVRREGAPGVYVDQRKVSALGLRVRRGCTYHGLSFNVDMDLSPFDNIDPCGYQGLEVTQLRDLIETVDYALVEQQLVSTLLDRLQDLAGACR